MKKFILFLLSIGVSHAYSQTLTAITPPSNITTTGATCSGTYVEVGGTFSSFYLQISTDNFDLNLLSFSATNSNGNMSYSLTGLTPGTLYYYRFRATWSVGPTTTYSSTHSFTTASIDQATGITFSNVGTSSMTLNWTNGSATNRIVVAHEGAAVNSNPVNGVDYTASSTFGSGTQIGTGNFVVHKGSPTVTVTGLKSSTTYHYKVFEYTGSGTSTVYTTVDGASNNPNSQATTAKTAAPTNQDKDLLISNITETTFTASWTKMDGDYRIVVVRTTGTTKANPSNGTTYTTANAAFGSGPLTGTGNYVVYNGAGNSVNVTNLSASTSYTVVVYAYNFTPTNTPSPKYKTTATAGVNSVSKATAGAATWTGATTTDWNTGTNWNIQESPSLLLRDIIIPSTPNQPTVGLDEEYDINNLTITEYASLTLDDGAIINVASDALLESPSDGGAAGQLVITGTGTLNVSGTSTMERYYDATSYASGDNTGAEGWYMSSPLNGSTPITEFGANWIYKWTESSAAWNTSLTSSTTFSEMEGALIKKSTNNPNMNTQTFLFSGSGTFNTGPSSITVTNANTSDVNYGWNLVGNPFPSAINWGAVSLPSGISASIYIYNPALSDYITCNQSTCDNGYGNPIIQPAQGFVVKATNSSVTLTFANTIRTAGTNSFMKNALVPASQLTLQASNGYFKTETSLFFEDDASNSDFDIKYDAYKRFSAKDSIPNIYTLLNDGSQLIFNTFNNTLLSQLPIEGYKIQLGIKQQIASNIKLSISNLNGIPYGYYIYLYDKSEDIYTDLRVSDYEVFIDAPVENRFELILRENAVAIKQKKNINNDFQIFNQEKSVFIKSSLFENNNGFIKVFDVTGRLMQSKATEKATMQTLNFNTSGVYIIKILINKTIYSQKVIVQ